MPVSARAVECVAAGLFLASLGCGSSRLVPPQSQSTVPMEVTRLRLPLSQNPVDPGAALRCYAQCQEQDTPQGYLECLADCPGFETTPGVACAPNEVPPLAACFTARSAVLRSEPKTSSVVVAVIGDIPFMVGVAAVCASQTEPCSEGGGLVP
jgi:hypothetical protein